MFALCFAVFVFLLGTNAQAGRLEEGFQGHAFGKLEKQPLENCIAEEVTSAKLQVTSCRFSLGEVKDITYSSLIYADIYYSYVLRTRTIEQCVKLKAILDEAWFMSTPTKEDSFLMPHERQHAWIGSGVTAVWEFSRITSECRVYVSSAEQRAKVDAIKKQEITDAAKSGI